MKEGNMKTTACTILISAMLPCNACSQQPDQGVTDIDSNTYKTVIIGAQEWMAENLRTTHYRDGTEIPNVPDNGQWAALDRGARVFYDNDAAHPEAFGKLYNWHAVNDPRGLCPEGWSVPTDGQWMELEMYLGMPRDEAMASSRQLEKELGTWREEAEATYTQGEDGILDIAHRGMQQNVGGKLKSGEAQPEEVQPEEAQPEEVQPEEAQPEEAQPNIGATNESGFSGLPGGMRDSDGSFDAMGEVGFWWTATEVDADDGWRESAWRRSLYQPLDWVLRIPNPKEYGFSVRCIRD
ncbi:MAG: hypothetical protein EA363_05470 [Balneolaceae bacterium]|nr:MAG: hypothetical protein EA363_05470 [Balneolaceae bacterium]